MQVNIVIMLKTPLWPTYQVQFLFCTEPGIIAAMDTKQQKRRQRLHLTFIYSLMVITVVFLVVIAAYLMQGYRLNWHNGTVEQGGLVQFDSHPDGARVTVNNTTLGNSTPSKITLSAGQRTVTMQRQGYRDWQKTVNVKAGSVLWLSYARMVAQNPSNKTIGKSNTVSSAAASGNKQYLAYIESAHKPTVRLADLSGDQPKVTSISLNTAHFTAPSDASAQTFAVTSWDKNNRHVLIKHSYDGVKTEWLVLDTQGKHELKNVTALLNLDIARLDFSQSDSRKLIALTAENDIRQINIADTTMTGPLISNVAEFSLYGDNTIVYTTKLDATTKQRTAGYLTIGADSTRTIRHYADAGTTPLHFRIEKYYNEVYYVIAYGETVDILKGPYVASDTKSASSMRTVASISVPGGVRALGFSTGEHRFVTAYNAASLTTYDLELLSTATVKTKVALKGDVNWIDGYHFILTDSEGLHMHDFDGLNHQIVAKSAVTNLPVVLSQNQKYFYSFAKNGDTVVLRQTKIMAE